MYKPKRHTNAQVKTYTAVQDVLLSSRRATVCMPLQCELFNTIVRPLIDSSSGENINCANSYPSISTCLQIRKNQHLALANGLPFALPPIHISASELAPGLQD